jgi:hypothetical protein
VSTVTAGPPAVGGPTVVVPQPSAYPDPITLPVQPKGDPDAARALATAYGTWASDLDAVARQVDAVVADLSLRWRGHGSTALHVPSAVIAEDLRTLSAGARSAAEHLEDYAEALYKAQHHHGWSLGKIVAVGAIVAVTAVAVVVTVGAAAPVGTVAALEVGEAIAGAEAAAGAATAAETAATTALSLTGQTMTALRGLSVALLPHLTNGAISTGLDTGLHLVTGHRVTGQDLVESFAAGFVGSATTTATRNALHATEAFRGASTTGRAALDTAALTATLGVDDALSQYAHDGRVDPTRLTEGALLTAFMGGVATLRNPTSGTGAVTNAPPSGQTFGYLHKAGMDLDQHEGAFPLGHTIDRHIAKTLQQLEQRLLNEPERGAVSTFFNQATAEEAIMEVVRQNPTKLALLLTGAKPFVVIKGDLPYYVGEVLTRGGTYRAATSVVVKLVMIGDGIVVRTSFVE